MAMQKLKKAALSDIAANLTSEEIGILGETFRQIDKDGDGTLSLKDLDEALAHRKYFFVPLSTVWYELLRKLTIVPRRDFFPRDYH